MASEDGEQRREVPWQEIDDAELDDISAGVLGALQERRRHLQPDSAAADAER